MVWSFLAILVLIALSAFFSGTEMAYSSSSELRLRRAAESGGKREKTAYWIVNHYDNALTTLLIGNNLVNTASSSISTMLVISLLGSGYAWVATVAMTILLLIFGEIVPKIVAKESSEKVAAATSLPLRGLMWVFHPIVLVAQGFIRLLSRLWKNKATDSQAVTEDDLEIMFDTAEDEGAIDENTSDLLSSALDFDDVMAYEIITPRVDMIAIDMDDPINEIIDTALSSPYSRIPVYQRDKDNIVGVLHLNRFLKVLVDDPAPDIGGLLMPACFVPSTALLPSILGTMREKKCHLVIVSDEYGGTLGILTMEDLLEELVGDIWDETDEINAGLCLLPDGQYEASGDMRVADLLDELDIPDRDFHYESTTLGGWATEMLGATPNVGDAFTYKSLHISVTALRKHRVTRLLVGVVDDEERKGTPSP